jgi:hypothetical protein
MWRACFDGYKQQVVVFAFAVPEPVWLLFVGLIEGQNVVSFSLHWG